MTTPSPLAPPVNHVFMDFENVHQVDLTLIGVKAVSFTLMVGPQQTRLDSALVEKLMEHSAAVRLVKLKTKANNALDFALSYHLGRAVLADPTACKWGHPLGANLDKKGNRVSGQMLTEFPQASLCDLKS